ncbi:PAS domain-containing protein [Polyangium sp. y55x31]|uniref:PAS domain-containing protein n=1 Tax=Polyangium sp. y55x31 TaxID=3042688 RepID=UPI002482A3C1|nr:PAS domain-containing protein [Polyangium sp. y55x31]MDI1478830.1 PAS domain-containing protein [Polyangium sp. y55x31]
MVEFFRRSIQTMGQTNDTIESLRAELAAAEERARLAEERAAVLEDLIALVPGVVLEFEQQPSGVFRPTFIGGVGLQTLLGYSVEDCMSSPEFFTSIIHPDDRAEANAEAMRFLEDGESHLSPHRMLRKGGGHTWVDTHFLYEPAEEGRPAKLHSVVFDVSRRACAEQNAQEALLKERALRQRLDGFVANVPGVVWESHFVPDPSGHRTNYVSDAVLPITGYTAEEWARPDFWRVLVHPEDHAHAKADAERAAAEGSGSSSYRWITKDGQTLWVNCRMTAILDESGATIGLRGVTMDITDLKRAETERAEALLRERVLEAQEDSLLALSTPLVPIDDEILAMTLVGGLDERRADRVLTTLLEGVTQTGARAVILDVTGVPAVEAQTADLVVKAAKAVSLLGAEVVLTGIRPEVARTLVELGAELGSIVTKGTLKAGIAHAMRARRNGVSGKTRR